MAIYFIRHGQSEFNAAFNGKIDPMIFDPALTKLGLEQAESARVNIPKTTLNKSLKFEYHADMILSITSV